MREPPERENPEVRQESDDLPGRPIVAVLAAAMALSLVLVGVAALLLSGQRGAIRRARVSERDLGAPRTVSGVDQRGYWAPASGQALNELERGLLESYGWVDRERGVARLPIEVGIERVLEEQKP